MKRKLQNSIPRVFFRFAPMGKVEKTRFEQHYTTFVHPALCAALKSPPKKVVWNRNFKIRFPWCFEQNYTTFVNPALCAAWKSPPKMVVWNRDCKIRFPGCFFVSPRRGKSKKRVLNKIIRPSSTRLYALLLKAHPKKLVWNRNFKILFPGCFEQNYTTFVNPALCAAWKSPPKMVVWNRNLKIRFPGFFFRFAPMGKVEKTRFEQNYTTFVNPALCAAWKSPPKMVVWNQSCKIRFPGCFFVSPRWGKSKKRVLNKIIRPSSTRLYALLLKAHPKKLVWNRNFKIVFPGCFEQNYTTFVNLALCAAWKSPPKMVV